MKTVTPAHCSHIYHFYAHCVNQNRCLANVLLMRGYYQWSTGVVEDHNNFYLAVDVERTHDSEVS